MNYSTQDLNVAEVENWLESIPIGDKNYYVKLLRLDAMAGKNLVLCAREYKISYEQIQFEKQMRQLPLHRIKREYFPAGWSGWMQWIKVKGEKYYEENKESIDAAHERDMMAQSIQNATQRGMERAINNANYDKRHPGVNTIFGTQTSGTSRY